MSFKALLEKCSVKTYMGANQFPLALWKLPSAGPRQPLSRRILCVHGFLDGGRSFVRFANALPANYEVFAPDLRGHGQSRPLPPGSATHYWEHAKDISVLLEHFRQQKTPFDLVIGHSMGGNVAALVAGGQPHAVEQIVFLDILGGLPEEPEAQPERFGNVLENLNTKKDFKPVATPADAVKRMKALNPHLSNEGAALMAQVNLYEKENGVWAFAFEKELRGRTPFRFPQAFWLSLFEKMKDKTWVIRGEKGYMPTPQDEPIVKERLLALGLQDVITFQDKGHHLHVDAAEELAAFVLTLPPPQQKPAKKEA